MPPGFRKRVVGKYNTTIKSRSRRDANLFLLDVESKAPGGAFDLAADDSAICDRARLCAKAVTDGVAGTGAREKGFVELEPGRWKFRGEGADPGGFKALEWAIEYAESQKVKPPQSDSPRGVLGRLKDDMWWRRALRKGSGRAVESLGRELGLVHKGAGIYSSDETLHRRTGQKRRNRMMLEEVLAFNEEGQEYTLAELADLSVSNPVIRRGELMVRIAGFEKVADDLAHVGEFITLTNPSRYHAYKIDRRTKRSYPNKKFDATTTPREAQAFSSKVWARIRAELGRHGIKLYGFRVAEPNHCGCPHWHMLVFMPPWARRRVRVTFERYALGIHPVSRSQIETKVPRGSGVCWLENDGGERGAKQHRVTFKAIDKSKGTAAGYIAKYIAKNIDGHALDADLYGGDPNEAAARVDAWAACWGIRQFQQLGGPPVTVWRELRRMDWEESGALEAARAAADRGDWSAFVVAMGGPLVKRADLPVRPAYLQEIDNDTGELPMNKYGEERAGAIVGLQVDNVYYVTRFHKWVIGQRGTHQGDLSPAWSPVNNCTVDREGPPIEAYADAVMDDGPPAVIGDFEDYERYRRDIQ